LPNSVPKSPPGLSARARRYWRDLHETYEFEAHEAPLVEEAVHTVSVIDGLRARVRAEGEMVRGPGLATVVNPALKELRQQQMTLARLQAVLRLPAGEPGHEQRGARQPRRTVRGVYGIRGVV